ncbi:MAG TPA: phospholipase D-like domain-containing protein [Ramlibacter sp.]|jgi:cardiolipin synthase|uniref:phospholipase D-like domain-containing protein n=1 Tax=Ramlibacter sp. TaxID=1917967 RepID=UPI002D617B07|nr:phospholipase D-like domain-containing protein [Ramlibacter sp.]HZY18140.1 phospholipase D-like domain-containing protein [Ramlibacter sp.]
MHTDLWILLLAATALLLGLVLWSARRHRSPTLQVECDAPIERLLPSLAGLTLGTALPGNRLTLLENGHFFDVLVARIAQARHTVHFETFLWKEGALGRRVAQALAERARAGLKVRVMLDATGSRKIGRQERRVMEEAGCRLVFFHKPSLITLGVLTDRTHRKLVVLDGREAFVGGHCITDDWLGDAEDHRHTADLSLHVRGPVVHSLQSAFSENWAGETGELFVGDGVFPALEQAGPSLVHAAFVKPENSAPAVKILHHAALCMARERLWIQNPYFIPEPEAIDAMGAAVRRGVDVRVLMPSTSGSDNPLVQHAGHRNFEKLLECGVRLFEYPHTLLHQKVMTIDGRWCALGSTNFDDRSFDTNDEITLSILDDALARQLDAVFERHARRANEIHLDAWRRRGAWHKLQDQACYLLNELL